MEIAKNFIHTDLLGSSHKHSTVAALFVYEIRRVRAYTTHVITCAISTVMSHFLPPYLLQYLLLLVFCDEEDLLAIEPIPLQSGCNCNRKMCASTHRPSVCVR